MPLLPATGKEIGLRCFQSMTPVLLHVNTCSLMFPLRALIIIEHGTRRAHLARITDRYLIRDRAGQFTGAFDAVCTAAGIQIIFSLRREVFDRLLILSDRHLRR
jgi:putative transposase